MSDYDLKTLRSILGITQAEMAAEIGLSRRAYVDAEAANEVRKLHLMAAERAVSRYAAHGWIPADRLPDQLLQEAKNLAAIVTSNEKPAS